MPSHTLDPLLSRETSSFELLLVIRHPHLCPLSHLWMNMVYWMRFRKIVICFPELMKKNSSNFSSVIYSLPAAVQIQRRGIIKIIPNQINIGRYSLFQLWPDSGCIMQSTLFWFIPRTFIWFFFWFLLLIVKCYHK